MEQPLSEALDDLILGRGVARGRHDLLFQGRPVRDEFVERLQANGFVPTRVSAVDIVAGEKVPAFHLDADGTAADFGWIRWEIFTPRSRRKLVVLRRSPDQPGKSGRPALHHGGQTDSEELVSGFCSLAALPGVVLALGCVSS